MEVSGQRYAVAAIYSRGKDPRYPLYRGLGGLQLVWTQARGKIICLCRGPNLDRPVVQSLARHYTD
jgi:hypothetical protein